MKAEMLMLFHNILVVQIVNTFYIEIPAVKLMASYGTQCNQNITEE